MVSSGGEATSSVNTLCVSVITGPLAVDLGVKTVRWPIPVCPSANPLVHRPFYLPRSSSASVISPSNKMLECGGKFEEKTNMVAHSSPTL